MYKSSLLKISVISFEWKEPTKWKKEPESLVSIGTTSEYFPIKFEWRT